MVEVQRLIISFANPLQIVEVESGPPSGQQLLTIAFGSFVFTAEGAHVIYNLPIDHTVSMQVSYTDSQGKPAKVDGVEWFPANPEIAKIEVDPDRSHDLQGGPGSRRPNSSQRER
jgi:hypothetical protein